METSMSEVANEGTGKLYVVGLGPGGAEDMSGRARKAIEACDLVAGYTVYIDLLHDEFPEKEILTTPMRKEVDRCRKALEAAAGGRSVAMVCSGDPGVYGMAGLIFELASEYPPVDIEVIPGVSASTGGAAVLGAPLMHDWCTISLSDLCPRGRRSSSVYLPQPRPISSSASTIPLRTSAPTTCNVPATSCLPPARTRTPCAARCATSGAKARRRTS